MTSLDNKTLAYIISSLAKKYNNYNYFAYETENQSFFTLGFEKVICLYSNKVELLKNNIKIASTPRKYSPSEELSFYTKDYFNSTRKIFGWFTFEFSLDELEIIALPKDTLLAVLFLPEVEIEIKPEEITAFGNSDISTKITEEIKQDIAQVDSNNLVPKYLDNIEYRLNDTYVKRVNSAISEINAGKYEKVIISRKVPISKKINFPQSYLNARLANPKARSFILQYNKNSALGFSPELIVKIDESKRIVTEPLAGTRAISKSKEDNQKLQQELYTDPKEVFEHAISVKTSCQEISKISENHSASVTEFMKIKERGSVQHMASSVEGKLAENKDAFAALAVLFPSVTASGLPKKAALEAITRLDEDLRGLYSGGIGYFDPSGTFEFSLVLRSLFKVDNELFLRAGAGIVSNSIGEREYEETCEKLSSIAPYLVTE